MNLFQDLAVGLLLVVIFAEWVRVARTGVPWAGPIVRTVIWLAAAGFILFPDSLTYFARSLGINRGADFLLYGLTLAFLATSFLLYARIVQLRRQMTRLVRHLALTQPLPPGTAVEPESQV